MTSRERLREVAAAVRQHCGCGEADCESSERAVDVVAAAVREALEEAARYHDGWMERCQMAAEVLRGRREFAKAGSMDATRIGHDNAARYIRALMPGEKP